MLCNTQSNYPTEIDHMTFFCDTSLQNKSVMDKYNALLSEGRYDEANEYLSQQEGVYTFSADFFNLIENRIYALQSHLLTKTPKQPFTYSAYAEPSIVTENMIWISDYNPNPVLPEESTTDGSEIIEENGGI